MFQSRKQDYFNWKPFARRSVACVERGFSPASRIILIESFSNISKNLEDFKFQSRKQDYFNWKEMGDKGYIAQLPVSVPQAGLF